MENEKNKIKNEKKTPKSIESSNNNNVIISHDYKHQVCVNGSLIYS